jgi:hypothetical protein
MQKRSSVRGLIAMAALAAGFFTMPARAEVFESGAGHAEAFLGLYDGDFPLYGLRGGGVLAVNWLDQKWGAQASLARHTRDRIVAGVRSDLDLIFVDFSLQWYFHSGDKVEWFAFAGPGWARVQVEVPGASTSDGEFTVHIGAGGKIDFADRWYFRPDARVRDGGRGIDFGDLEVSAGVGFVFGGGNR